MGVSQFENISIVGKNASRLPTTSTVCFHGRLSHRIVEALDELGVCVSGGAACHAGGPLPSETMLSLGMSEQDAKAIVRFSFGPGNTLEEVDTVLSRLERVLSCGGLGQ
jgi:cysteine desulfurase